MEIFSTKFGSHLYGTDTPASDTDYKGVFLPDSRDILLGKVRATISQSTGGSNTKNTNQDIDTELFAYNRFFQLLLEGQAVALDMLFATPLRELCTYHPKYWNENIWNQRHQFLHRSITPYIGYARQQANKYGLKGSRMAVLRECIEFFQYLSNGFHAKAKLTENWFRLQDFAATHDFCAINAHAGKPALDGTVKIIRLFECCGKQVQENDTASSALAMYENMYVNYGERARAAEKNEGVDWKALSHAVRVAQQGLELLNSHFITFPRPERQLLIDIKVGALKYNAVAELIVDLFDQLVDAQNKSTLPESPNWDMANQLIYDVYRERVLLAHG